MKHIKILIAGSLLALAGGLQAESSAKKLIINNIRNNSLFISAAPTLEQAMAQPFAEIKKLETYNKPIGFDGEVHLLFKQKDKPIEGDEIDHYTFEADKNIKFEFRKSLSKLQASFDPKRLQRLLKYGYIDIPTPDVDTPERAYSLVLRGRKADDAKFHDISNEIVIYSPESTEVIERKPGYAPAPTGPGWNTDAPDLPPREKEILPELPERKTSEKEISELQKEAPTTDAPPVPTDPSLQPPMPKDTTPDITPDTSEPPTGDVPEEETTDTPEPPTDGPPAPEARPPMPTIDEDTPTKPILPFDPSQLLKGKEGLKKIEEDTKQEKPKKETGYLEGVLQKRFEGLNTGDYKDEDTDNSEWEDDEDYSYEEDEDTKDEAPEPKDTQPPMPANTDITTKPSLPFSTEDLLKQKDKIESSEKDIAPAPFPRDDEEKKDEESLEDLIKKRREAIGDDEDDEEDDEEWDDEWDD